MMEEAISVKAPTTRSRRGISVEQIEENKSPAINTPTKKRGGRRGVKPDLELIDENIPENATTRRAAKTLAKDIGESQERVVTPSRRSTRIKSNTSIVSETAIAIDSPRSKRAARRASQAGSDNEGQVTPIRPTRRNRKDSTSSIEKEHQIPTKQGVQITEVIIEEPEINMKNTQPQNEKTVSENISANNTRRSPRLLEKNKNTSQDQEDSAKDSEAIASSKKNKDDISSSTIASKETDNPVSEKFTESKLDESQISQKNRLSTSSANLIKEFNMDKTKFAISLNKSDSDAACKENKAKRHRTKSWSTITTTQNSLSSSDNEINKDKINTHIKFPVQLDDKSRSGDGYLNTTVNLKFHPNSKPKDSTNFVAENNNESLNKIGTAENIIANESGNNIISLHKKNIQEGDLLTSELLSKEPSGNIKTTIFIEDSDSNSEKVKTQSRYESEDQCVPVVHNPLVVIPRINFFPSILDKSDNNIINKPGLTETIDSCEPMDVDETILESTILSETQSKELSTSERKSASTCDFTETNLPNKEIANNSVKKCDGQNIDKSGIETKSTLILSQLKDNSIADSNISLTVTSQATNKLLSKTGDDLNISHENDLKKNISLHCSTSTPLQDKNLQKFKGIDANFASTVSESNIKSKDSGSKNTVKQMFHEDKILNKLTVFESCESSEDENHSKNSFCKDQGQKISEHVVSNKSIQNSRLKKVDTKLETDSDSNKQCVNENHEEEDLFMQKQRNSNDEEGNSTDEEGNSSDEESTTKNIKKSSDVSSSEAEEINSNDSQEKSNFVDHEADDAGTDYESGDSQDESERQYHRENEIIDQGETLSTEEEFSDDSDYEKDSFIVSANEDDDELLDGTDDDLSMSSNELKMNARSKKKYNDRKMKEQKKASREMFDSRHKLKSSNKSSNSEKGLKKKNKRQLSSSESEEDLVRPRKTNRRRLDSTKEATLIIDENEMNISMKTNASLTDNVADVNDANEIEITVYNGSVEENDPLCDGIKEKPPQETPQKNITSTENIIQIDKNASRQKAQIELADSFEETITHENDPDSLSSDNENIIQNYDSILKDLNKSKIDKTNIGNSSLNCVTKIRKKDTPSIIEDLNLTQVKTVKKDKIKNNRVTDSNSQAILSKTYLNNESSSDSIDLHLLFSEESNNSEDVQSKKNTKTKSDGFTPITEVKDETDITELKGKENDVNFFIDTVGSISETLNKSQNISLLKNDSTSIESSDDSDSNKNVTSTAKQIFLDQMENDIAETENSDDEAPLEICYQKKKDTKRKLREANTLNVPMIEADVIDGQTVETSPPKTPASEKKKKRSLDIRYDELNDITNDPTANTSVVKTSAKKTSGKEKKRQSESNCEEQNDEGVPIETTTSDKIRKKSPSKLLTLDSENPIVPEESADHFEKISSKRKRKSSVDISKKEILSKDVDAVENIEESSVGSKKKKRKISAQDEIVPDTLEKEEIHHEHLQNNEPRVKFEQFAPNSTGTDDLNKKRNKKRKEREDDRANPISKVRKEITFEKVPRLPISLIMKLDEKPKKNVIEKPEVVSTTQFRVQETKKKKRKPSKYLEDSVYLNENDDTEGERRRNRKLIEKPKVLPFVPTASTSSSGYTTAFKVNVIPKEIKFVAQTNTVTNFRDNYLYSKKIKRIGTYEMYKRQRSAKMSKY